MPDAIDEGAGGRNRLRVEPAHVDGLHHRVPAHVHAGDQPQRAPRPQHEGIADQAATRTLNLGFYGVNADDGTLHPALLKLEQEGAIASEWGHSENGRRAKFYTLTRRGRAAGGACGSVAGA